jgi:AhpD family alkylhydroperoxidase
MTTSERFSFYKVLPDGYKALSGLQKYVNDCGLDPTLQELVKLRSSQLNGCVFCLDMHLADAKKIGFSDQRLFTLTAWHESPFFTEKEKALLALTDAITLIAEEGLDDEIYDEARAHFSEEEIAKIMVAICMINSWNRLMVATQAPPASLAK